MLENSPQAQKAKKPTIKPAQTPLQTVSPQTHFETVNLLLQRAVSNPDSVSPADAKRLQGTIGNQALGQLAHTHVEPAADMTARHSLQHMLDSQGIEIQRDPIASDKLNVVGEDHRKSGKIRGIEKKYLKDVTNSSGYWSETDFRVGELGWLDIIDRRPKGDPSWLHVEFLLAGLNGTMNQWAAEPDAKTTEKDYNDSIGYGWHDSVKNFMWDIGEYVQTGYFDLTAEQVKRFTDNRALFEQANEHFEMLREAVKDDDMNNRAALVRQARNSLRKFTNAVYGNLRTEGEVNDSRNDRMHQSANQESNRKGAWKVGKNHARALDTDNKYNDKQYNVTTQAEFEKELKDAGYEEQMRAAGYFAR